MRDAHQKSYVAKRDFESQIKKYSSQLYKWRQDSTGCEWERVNLDRIVCYRIDFTHRSTKDVLIHLGKPNRIDTEYVNHNWTLIDYIYRMDPYCNDTLRPETSPCFIKICTAKDEVLYNVIVCED